MFKQGSFEEELLRSMQKNLLASKVEDKYGFNKLSKATDLLNHAAILFEKAGMFKEHQEVCNILADFTKETSKKRIL